MLNEPKVVIEVPETEDQIALIALERMAENASLFE